VGSWNRWLELAPECEFMARLDDDDVYLPRMLETVVATLDAEPDVALVYSAVEYIDDAGNVIEVRHPLSATQRLTPRAALGRFVESNRVPTPTVLLRMSAVRTVGRYDPAAAWCADWDMWLRIAQRYPVVYLDDVLARYRISSDSATTRGEADGSVIERLRYTLEKTLASVPSNWVPARQVRRGRRTIASYELMLAFGQLYRGNHGLFRERVSDALRYAPDLLLSQDGCAALMLALASLAGNWGPHCVWRLRDAVQASLSNLSSRPSPPANEIGEPSG
jgi:hypothetical protein